MSQLLRYNHPTDSALITVFILSTLLRWQIPPDLLPQLAFVVFRIEQATRLSFLPFRLVALSGTPITACKWTQSQGWLWCARLSKLVPLLLCPQAVASCCGQITRPKRSFAEAHPLLPTHYPVSPCWLFFFTSLTNLWQTLTFLGYWIPDIARARARSRSWPIQALINISQFNNCVLETALKPFRVLEACSKIPVGLCHFVQDWEKAKPYNGRKTLGEWPLHYIAGYKNKCKQHCVTKSM